MRTLAAVSGVLAACALATPAVSATRTSHHAAKPAARAVQEETARPAVPFIEDDYARALAEAKARDVPILVDTWAPW